MNKQSRMEKFMHISYRSLYFLSSSLQLISITFTEFGWYSRGTPSPHLPPLQFSEYGQSSHQILEDCLGPVILLLSMAVFKNLMWTQTIRNNVNLNQDEGISTLKFFHFWVRQELKEWQSGNLWILETKHRATFYWKP